jgi:hypothetical protein
MSKGVIRSAADAVKDFFHCFDRAEKAMEAWKRAEKSLAAQHGALSAFSLLKGSWILYVMLDPEGAAQEQRKFMHWLHRTNLHLDDVLALGNHELTLRRAEAAVHDFLSHEKCQYTYRELADYSLQAWGVMVLDTDSIPDFSFIHNHAYRQEAEWRAEVHKAETNVWAARADYFAYSAGGAPASTTKSLAEKVDEAQEHLKKVKHSKPR